MNFNFQTILQDTGEWLMTSGLRIFLIIILTLIAVKACQVLMDRIFQRLLKKHKDELEIQKRSDTLKSVSRHVLNITIIIVALMMVLKEIGVEIGPMLAAAGVIGIAVGFGAQQLIKDLIQGFFILMDDQIRVGDVVQIAGKGGLVENVNLRMITLRDLSGNVHFIRNGEITVVTNMTKEYSRYVFDIGVAYRENVDEVIEVIKQVDEEMRNDMAYKYNILEPIEILGLDQFADSAVIIKARTKTKPIQQWAVAREFNRRLKKKFDELGIEIPFPHTTLYMGQNKDGSAPPMNLVIRSEQK
ncbi:MAG: mechanosensitive ion channel family protein [Sedimentisphaerales bacterium]|nr:mechanosensitive ion channel family protein [Sedimentisphaerales bacterium]